MIETSLARVSVVDADEIAEQLLAPLAGISDEFLDSLLHGAGIH